MSNLSDLIGGGGSGKLIRTDTITASGTYAKPTDVQDDDLVIVDIWSGGAGGAVSTGTTQASGGRPGMWVQAQFRGEELPDTMPAIVGAGGAGVDNSQPLPGGASSILGINVPGGMGAATSAGGFDFTGSNANGTYFLSIGQISTSSPSAHQLFVHPSVVAYAMAQLPYSTGAVHADSNGGSVNPQSYVFPNMGSPGATAPGSSGVGTARDAAPTARGGRGGSAGTQTIPATNGQPRGGGGGGRNFISTPSAPAGDGGRGEILIRYYRGTPR